MSTISLIKSKFKLPDLPKAWGTVAAMTKTLQNAGFKDVQVTKIEIGLLFEDADKIAKFIIRTMPYTARMTSSFTGDERIRWEGLSGEWVKREYKGGKIGGIALVGISKK